MYRAFMRENAKKDRGAEFYQFYFIVSHCDGVMCGDDERSIGDLVNSILSRPLENIFRFIGDKKVLVSQT
jgi:hypothetical protein